MREDRSPTWTIRERPYGLSATARRSADDGRAYYRTNQFLLPFGSLIAPDKSRARMMRFWVPRDDETTLVIAINYHEDRPVSEEEAAGYRAGEYGFCVLRPGTDWPVPGPDNDYLMNREVQRTKTTTGIPGIRVQDLAMVEVMGVCVDRCFEHSARATPRSSRCAAPWWMAPALSQTARHPSPQRAATSKRLFVVGRSY